jgi:SAM-dependent methyltransferase
MTASFTEREPIVTTTPTAGLEPADIKRLGNAFCHAKLMLTAIELGLFADLDAAGAATAEEICSRLGLAGRGLRDFLDALVALGLLTRTAGRYQNAEPARRHLVPGHPTYLGGFLDRSNRVLYPAWGSLTQALRTGEPQVASAAAGAFEKMLAQPQQRAHYLRMMDSVSTPLAPLLAGAFDWTAIKDLVDVGGARGNLAAHLVRAHPHLRATVFDLPAMAQAHAEHMVVMSPPGPVRFVGGDFFADPLPCGDALVIGHVLHNWSPQERQVLVRKAFAAVRPGGALLVYDAMLDKDPTDLARLVVSLNMLLVTAGGSEYPVSQCQRWLSDAGFVEIRRQPLGGADTLVVGRKSIQ